jgi:diacylglycerol kinase family enzyme
VRRVLIVNPAASGVTEGRLARVRAELEAVGPLETVLSERAGHGMELAAAASVDCDTIYVFAGDGGYNEVVNGMQADVPVGFLPGGATSVVPRALGLPRDPIVCARRLARSTGTRRISLGKASYGASAELPSAPRRFTFCAGVGLDAELVRAVDRRGRQNGRRPGDLAFAWELVRILAAARGTLEPRLEVEGAGRCAFVFAAKCDPYSYAGSVPIRAAPAARFELGLDIFAPRRLRPPDILRVLWWLLANPGQTDSPHAVYMHDADRVVVRCDRPTPFQVDGEDLGDVQEVVLEAERNALTVLV